MNARCLLLLLLVTLSSSGLASAQSVSVWEPTVWGDRESLVAPKPDPMFWIAGSGRLSGQFGTNHPFDLPPAITVLRDEAFREALCREMDADDAKAFAKEIESKIKDYEAKFLEVWKRTEAIENAEARIARIDAFERETKALVGELRTRLTPAQQETCERAYPSGVFYLYGPVDFARRRGASETELADIASRMRELHEPLRTDLRELETATILEVLGKLDGDGVEKMRKLVESASPRRYGVLFTLHDDLAKFEAPPIGMTKAARATMDRYRLSDLGAPTGDEKIPVPLILDAIELLSVQDFGAGDQEVRGLFVNGLMEFEVNPTDEVRDLKEKQSSLHREAVTGRDLDKKLEAFQELTEVQEKLFGLRNEEVAAVERLLSEDGRRAIEEGRLLFFMQRHGCTSVLASKFAHDRFGLSIGPASWQALGAEAAAIAASLRERAVEIQQAYVKNVYRETSLEKEFEEAWARTVDEDRAPLLEALILHTEEGADRRGAIGR